MYAYEHATSQQTTATASRVYASKANEHKRVHVHTHTLARTPIHTHTCTLARTHTHTLINAHSHAHSYMRTSETRRGKKFFALVRLDYVNEHKFESNISELGGCESSSATKA